jgi:hypothetical protein
VRFIFDSWSLGKLSVASIVNLKDGLWGLGAGEKHSCAAWFSRRANVRLRCLRGARIAF